MTCRGFTLVEVLVVIAIIAILGGLSMAGWQVAQETAYVNAEKHAITMIKVAIGNFGREWGDPPPNSLGIWKVKGNSINEGNESLFAHLQARKRNGPFLTDDGVDEDRWQNADGDKLSAGDLKKIRQSLNWTRTGNQLLEYTDFWGNPYVYIPREGYGKKFQYQDSLGRTFQVEASKNSQTGEYYAPTTFQLWSLGPDGENQNGGGDDVCSWKF